MGLPEELVAQHVRRYLNPLYRPQPLPGLDSTAAVHPPGTPGTHWRTASMWDDVLASLATVLVSSGSSVPAQAMADPDEALVACATASYAAMPKLRCMFQLSMPPICTHTKDGGFRRATRRRLGREVCVPVVQIRVATQEA